MSRLRPIGHEDRLSLVDHLDELRTRLIACVIAFMAAFSICYWQNGWLLDTINKPVRDTQSLNNSNSKRSPLQDSAVYQLKSSAAQRLSIPALAGQKAINNVVAGKLKLTPAEKALFRAAEPPHRRRDPGQPSGRRVGADGQRPIAGDPRRHRAVRDDLHRCRLRGRPAGAALHPLPALRLRPAGVQPGASARWPCRSC